MYLACLRVGGGNGAGGGGSLGLFVPPLYGSPSPPVPWHALSDSLSLSLFLSRSLSLSLCVSGPSELCGVLMLKLHAE